eukprot:gene7498-8293_t
MTPPKEVEIVKTGKNQAKIKLGKDGTLVPWSTFVNDNGIPKSDKHFILNHIRSYFDLKQASIGDFHKKADEIKSHLDTNASLYQTFKILLNSANGTGPVEFAMPPSSADPRFLLNSANGTGPVEVAMPPSSADPRFLLNSAMGTGPVEVAMPPSFVAPVLSNYAMGVFQGSCQSHLCAMGNCSKHVSNGRLYCTRYHHKLQFLHEEHQKFLAKKDYFGVFLTNCIQENCYKGKNPLQPSAQNHMIAPPPSFDNLLDWFKFMRQYKNVLHATLGVKVDGTPNKKLQDQKLRAEYLAGMFIPALHKVVRLMDGFGGFTLLFIEAILSRNGGESILKTLKIELIDLDETVNSWHTKVFRCSSIICRKENIVDKNYPVPPTTLLYMNFCGIAASFEHVCEYLKSHPTVCLLSFSLQRAAKSFRHALMGHARWAVWTIRKVQSIREDFITFHVIMKNNYI